MTRFSLRSLSRVLSLPFCTLQFQRTYCTACRSRQFSSARATGLSAGNHCAKALPGATRFICFLWWTHSHHRNSWRPFARIMSSHERYRNQLGDHDHHARREWKIETIERLSSRCDVRRLQLGGDRRIIRIALPVIVSLRSISAGVFDWLKIRLAWIRLPERGPGDCNGQWDGDLHVVNAAWVATPALRGTGQIRGGDCRRDFLPAWCCDYLV